MDRPDLAWTPPVTNPKTIHDSWANIQHTLDVYADSTDDDAMLLTATSNVYGQGVRTGITWGDLRRVARNAGLTA